MGCCVRIFVITASQCFKQLSEPCTTTPKEVALIFGYVAIGGLRGTRQLMSVLSA